MARTGTWVQGSSRSIGGSVIDQRARLGPPSSLDESGNSPVLAWVQTSRVKPLPPFEAGIALHTWYGVQPISTRRPGCIPLGAWEVEGSVGVWAWGDLTKIALKP